MEILDKKFGGRVTNPPLQFPIWFISAKQPQAKWLVVKKQPQARFEAKDEKSEKRISKTETITIIHPL
jgi:hypothetical protein